MTPVQLFHHVVQVAPGFAPIHAEHMRDYDELLVHVLMADLLRFVGRRLAEQPSAPGDVLAILNLLEREIEGGNADTENAIAVSFLENLEADHFFAELYALLGPKLRAAHALFAWNQPQSNNAN